ncbi:hypothetical protein F0L68_15745 [Solihabitans fulvus]|uniref:S-adenosyl methyltransferase n=1 Tax=Solihabitans fulvus TaxID=1892852 RepID=A0A5B2XF57_9PSEU|nr:SAM-dependent methyltransferase [Solihabitans fulvus]KAA2261699.1 hypothetical protein F0L68_15745 [Solihabitans fulvus]
MEEQHAWSPRTIDLSQPNAARVYDYYLGGACNFAVDRAFADRVLAILPEARLPARLNRAFLRRVVAFCVRNGIRQFLDIGSGIPTAGNVHDVAHRADPSCRVVYVDNDPVAVAHGELILADDDLVATLAADFRDPETVLTAPVTRKLLDFAEPVAVLMTGLLHYVPDADGPHGVVARYREAMAADSYLVLSHITSARLPPRVREIGDLYRASPTPLYDRGRRAISGFFTGFELERPGLVYAPEWRPDSPEDVGEHPESCALYVGVGRRT